MSHIVTVPDYIWEWAQRETGLKKPTTLLRNLLSQAMIDQIQNVPVESLIPGSEDDFAKRWAALSMSLDQFDERFTLARKVWIEAHGSEQQALDWLEKGVTERKLNNPRGFVMDWYKKNGN